MISLLSPLALVGGLLLAIPIVVHLFRPRTVRVREFSSLRWLHLSQQRAARRVQWHQLLLFLLRSGFIALLVLALARPVLSPRGGGGLTERFVVIDVTRSMAYAAPDRPAPIESAKELAATVMSQGVDGDRTAVLLAGRDTRVLAPLSTEPEGCLPRLRAVVATAGDGRLTSALEAIRPMLADRRDGADVEIVFITDNQQRAWDQAAIADFVRDLGADARQVRVRVIDTGVAGPQNAWIASARLVEAGRGENARRSIRVQASCIGDAAQQRTLRLAAVAGQPERSQPVTLEPGRLAAVDFELPRSLDLRGQVATLWLDPADDLASDDRWFLDLDSRGVVRVLVVEPVSNRPEPLRAAFHLRTALAALQASHDRGIDVEARTAGDVASREFTAADVTVLCGVPDLPEAAVAALEARVAAGGGLALFLGPDIDTDFYDTRLHRAAAPDRGLLPAPVAPTAAFDSATGVRRPEPTPLAAIRWSSPILAPLEDPVFGDLAQARLTPHRRIAADRLDAARILAWIGTVTPAIVEHAVGAGRVLVFNTSADDTWTDLPRRRSYVPLIDRVVAHLSGGTAARSFNVGDVVDLPAPAVRPDERIEIVTPAGRRLPARLRSLAASATDSLADARAFLQVDATDDVGVYRVVRTTAVDATRPRDGPPAAADPPEPRGDRAGDEQAGGNGELMRFVVQAGRAESVLNAIDGGTLERWWAPVPLEMQTSAAGGRDAVARVGRMPLWPWLVAAAAIVLLAEMHLVHRLCPQMHPDVVRPAVRRRGLAVLRPPGVTTSGRA